jgi:predicted SpoU family rRNA methylase
LELSVVFEGNSEQTFEEKVKEVVIRWGGARSGEYCGCRKISQ